jgi:hypothetical protein
MRWPLDVFALLVVLLHVLKSVTGDKDGAWGRAAEAARHIFIPFAAVAVLTIALGKPTLAAQYSAWALLVLQAAHAGATQRNLTSVARYAHWVSLALVAYLWIAQLPVFDKIPV